MYKAKRICLNQNSKDQSEVFNFILTIEMKRHFVLFLGQIWSLFFYFSNYNLNLYFVTLIFYFNIGIFFNTSIM